MCPHTASINNDDAKLVEQCRSGDSAAMERLILKYQNRIYNVILRMCADRDDAAELTQDTFVKIIESIGGFKGRSSFYTWAFRIAVNLTLNHCQRSAKINPMSLDVQDGEHSGKAKQALSEYLQDDKAIDPSMAAQHKELYEIATRLLMQLDDAQRAVVVLRDIEGMNYTQIADVLGIQLGTVRSRLSRARSNLRAIMEAILK